VEAPYDAAMTASHPPHAGHDPAHPCPDCGRAPGIAREYKLGDRFLDALLLALCAEMDLTATRSSNRRHASLIVRAPEVATQDRLWARFQALMPEYEAKLHAAASAYLREHCGAELRRAPR
jgi:hypothetical protein